MCDISRVALRLSKALGIYLLRGTSCTYSLNLVNHKAQVISLLFCRIKCHKTAQPIELSHKIEISLHELHIGTWPEVFEQHYCLLAPKSAFCFAEINAIKLSSRKIP